MSKVASGWVPTHSGRQVIDDGDLVQEGRNAMLEVPSAQPLASNQLPGAELDKWSKEWAVGSDYPELDWDIVEAEVPEMVKVDSFRKACLTFAEGTAGMAASRRVRHMIIASTATITNIATTIPAIPPAPILLRPVVFSAAPFARGCPGP